jgi:hypothetical protein
MRWISIDHEIGAAWYSGAGERYTLPSTKPHHSKNRVSGSGPSPIGANVNGRTMPLGRPVVPDE